MLSVSERHLPGEETHPDGPLVVENLLQVDISFGSSRRFTLEDSHCVARLAPADVKSDGP